MKTILTLLVPVVAASLLLVHPAEAQTRESTAKISSFTMVSGPPHNRHSTVHRGHPSHRGAYHAPRSHRSHRHERRNEQARMADWYASTTLSQVNFARRVGCANSHPRWSTSYQDHYHWAYANGRNQAMREIENRDRALASCGYYRR
jgi:hypothetical protein